MKGVDTRMANRDALDTVIEQWTVTQPVSVIVDAMTVAGVPASPILSLEQILDDENVAHRRMVRELPVHGDYSVHVVASPLPAVERTYSAMPPEAGEHTEELLAELGFTAAGVRT